MIGRLFSLIKKEFLAIKNDKKSLVVVIIPPLIQVVLFSFAATLEVKNIDLAVLDRSGGEKSRQLLHGFKGSAYIRSLQTVHSLEEAKKLLDTQRVLAYMIIPSEFEKKLNAGDAKVEVVLDGRRSNTAQIAQGYLTQILLNFQNHSGSHTPVEIFATNFYNPNLNNFWWIVPHLFGSITMVVAILLTSLSIARERELGTFDQILVSPLRPFEILLGKLLPALLISLFESTVILFVALEFFGVPLNGSVWLLYLGVAVFLFSISGIGLFISAISAISATQQQAILGSFVFLLPSFLLSGFATPVENMPQWLQPFSYLIPLKYHLVLIKGVFLKDISLEFALTQMVPMFALGLIFLAVAMLFFKRKIA